MENRLKSYRSFQVLEKMFNAFLKARILPALLIGTISMNILSVFVCISLHGEIEISGLLLFLALGFNAALVNIITYTLASTVNTRSTQILRSFRTKMVGMRRKSELRRQIASCSVLGVQFGSNFIDRGTPLVIQDFCLNPIVSLSLLVVN